MARLADTFKPESYFVQIGGFANSATFNEFCRFYGISFDAANGGYPVFHVIKMLNEDRKSTGRRKQLNMSKLDEMKKQEEVRKLQIHNMERSGELIKREYAKERVRLAFQNVASKIRYAIKNTAPRLVGMENARLIEELITKAYNGALKLLEEQANMTTWEDDPGGGIPAPKLIDIEETILEAPGVTQVLPEVKYATGLDSLSDNSSVTGNIELER